MKGSLLPKHRRSTSLESTDSGNGFSPSPMSLMVLREINQQYMQFTSPSPCNEFHVIRFVKLDPDIKGKNFCFNITFQRSTNNVPIHELMRGRTYRVYSPQKILK